MAIYMLNKHGYCRPILVSFRRYVKMHTAVVYRNVPPTRNSGQKQNQNSRNGHFLCILSDFENHILEDPFHLEFKAFSDVFGIRGAWRMRAVCKLIENPRFCIEPPPPTGHFTSWTKPTDKWGQTMFKICKNKLVKIRKTKNPSRL